MKRIDLFVLPLMVVLGLRSPGQLVPPPHVSPLIVHEWGTITTRHAPDGTPEGRLNRISPSEVLPEFVHHYEPPSTQNIPQNALIKTPFTPGRPDVTMRLETPVIYFYPAAGSELPPFDVSVRFRGGIVNEFYPVGEASVAVDLNRVASKMQAGLINSRWDGDVLDNYVVGSLRWAGLLLKNSVPAPHTSSHVWLAPRQVKSTGVLAPSGEGEQYLFYRGVAHLDALFQTELGNTDVRLRAPQRLLWMSAPAMTVENVWLVDIRPNGTAAFRQQKGIRIAKSAASQDVVRVSLFGDGEYARDGLGRLRSSMKEALIAGGLFEDEAEAMLETWEDSYFRTPGLRLFYLVPREWVNYFLPLQVSVPHELTRVLVGRIDLLRGPR